MTAPEISIREAEVADAPAVARMATALGVITSVGGPGMTPDAVATDLIDGDGLTLIVGEVDGVVQGYALYSVAYETGWAARGLYMSDLYVDPDARRHGLARALMRDLARRAVEDNGSFLWWIVMPGNPAAEAFYESLGAHIDPPQAMAIYGPAFDALLT